MYTIGTYISWKGLAIFCSVVPGIIFFVLYFLKDSPASYMMRNRPDLSRKTLIWLRNTADIEEELYAIQRSVDESRRSAERLKISNILCVQDPTIRKPLMLTGTANVGFKFLIKYNCD